MRRIGRGLAIVLLASLLTVFSVVAASRPAFAGSDFNDEYIFATTKEVSHMDAPAGLKLTLYPVTIVLDAAFLPFAVIAGFVT